MAPNEGVKQSEGHSKQSEGHVIIRDIYVDERTPQRFEAELDEALKTRENLILIEPIQLGKATKKFIIVGNMFHKCAVLSGFGSLLAIGFAPRYLAHKIGLPLAVVGWISTSVYDIAWQFDPCSKYQVLRDQSKLSVRAIRDLNSTSALVLERKDDSWRMILHNSINLATAAYFSWKFYEWYIK